MKYESGLHDFKAGLWFAFWACLPGAALLLYEPSFTNEHKVIMLPIGLAVGLPGLAAYITGSFFGPKFSAASLWRASWLGVQIALGSFVVAALLGATIFASIGIMYASEPVTQILKECASGFGAVLVFGLPLFGWAFVPTGALAAVSYGICTKYFRKQFVNRGQLTLPTKHKHAYSEQF